MNWLQKTLARRWCVAALFAVAACRGGDGVDDSSSAIIDPPQECSPNRPDCSISSDFPVQGDLNATNSAGVRYSQTTGSLVIDRASSLPDSDLDGVPDDADDCPMMPGWRTPCDGDPSNDGIYQVLFFDPLGTPEAVRTSIIATTADIPAIDIYFLVDATTSMAGEIGVLQNEIMTVISDIEALFDDPRLGLGLYREYPVDTVDPVVGTLAMPYSQAPYHHILDLTDDTLLFEKAVSTLNTVSNMTEDREAGSQALFAVASGQGLGDFVPNRAPCADGEVGYPCFRSDVMRLVLNISDAEMYNGPAGPPYPAFMPSRPGVMDLPPVQMFPDDALFDADDAVSALDLGDLSAQSLTLMGMSSLLSNQVNTAMAPGCITGMPPDNDMDDKDVVITFRFDSPGVTLVDVFADNTHWPGANVALFDNMVLDPLATLGCDGMATGNWGAVQLMMPIATQQYYLVVDGQVPAGQTVEPEGAFSLSIVHDGDPSNPTWMTVDAPVDWAPVETALLANDIRVASVLSPKDMMTMPSDADPDARAVATATGAVTKVGGQWVGEITAPDGDGLGAQITITLNLILDESIYDIQVIAVEDPATPMFDETDFIASLGAQDCAEGETFECNAPSMDRCPACEPGADIEFELRLLNDSVPQAATSQVFDFEIILWVDDTIELERIPVRVMVPDDATLDFNDAPGANFYQNSYDSIDRCTIPPERPDWGDLTWTGSTPGDSSIEFQIRAANTTAELDTAVPAVVIIPTDTTDTTLDVGQELINDGIPNGLPFLRVTAILNPTSDLANTPELEGWELEFVCFAAE
ncbi:MAG: VWA domain-containing protein [Myxococcales bacterium]|nr:VWA domain-containing protein [Myxococcales bacterium]MDH3844330.1 VWA domain-containing protein [Myxococcales bacterium]